MAALNIRLRSDGQDFPQLMSFQATRNHIQPRGDDERDLATALALNGGDTRVVMCEFIVSNLNRRVSARHVPLTLEVLDSNTQYT